MKTLKRSMIDCDSGIMLGTRRVRRNQNRNESRRKKVMKSDSAGLKFPSNLIFQVVLAMFMRASAKLVVKLLNGSIRMDRLRFPYNVGHAADAKKPNSK